MNPAGPRHRPAGVPEGAPRAGAGSAGPAGAEPRDGRARGEPPRPFTGRQARPATRGPAEAAGHPRSPPERSPRSLRSRAGAGGRAPAPATTPVPPPAALPSAPTAAPAFPPEPASPPTVRTGPAVVHARSSRGIRCDGTTHPQARRPRDGVPDRPHPTARPRRGSFPLPPPPPRGPVGDRGGAAQAGQTPQSHLRASPPATAIRRPAGRLGKGP